MHRNIRNTILAAAIFICTSALLAVELPARTKAAWPGKKSSFHGFDQYDFKVEEMDCKVVVPGEIAAGKPWIWRARFFGHQPQPEIELLKKGFHVAYVDVANLFGSPKAVARWDAFYRYLTETHGFSKKPALEGMSRGGLIVYNWAAANPDKVSCIYADAPVCDFKSWPAGLGKSKGNPPSWQNCLKAYGLTHEQALEYEHNPIDNLKPLAKAAIPLLHVCGADDKTVPVDENSLILKQRYEKLGGKIDLILKPGIGHHPHSLKDPTPIVNFILANTLDDETLKVSKLRCEYMDNPLGIDNAMPQLSWKLKSSQTDQRQTAYRILVASEAARLEKNIGDLWDSGKVDSGDETSIVYSGKELTAGSEYFWKVMVWDKDDKPGKWSNTAKWTMGLMDTEWQVAWIGFDKPRVDAENNVNKEKLKYLLVPPRYLRKEFIVNKPVKRATLYASALGNYKMSINSREIGEDYFSPGWTDYRIRVYYNTYDVTEIVKEGGNAIGGILTDGWYAGYVGWKKSRDHYGKNPRLSAMLVLEHKDNTKTVVATDGSWKANTGPVLEGSLIHGETYDAQLEMNGWDKAGFDAGAWVDVDVTDKIDAKIEAYPSNTVKIFQEIVPLSVTEPVKGNFVFDMGTNFAGFARLKVQGPRGTKVTLKFGERLNADGTVYTENLRSARVIDTYICKGEGVEIWQPKFTFHGFQYVGMTGFPGKPGKDAITGIELTSATPVTGSFECSDQRLNQLYHNICQTQRANFIDIPTDCPQRDERMGWTGDAQAYIRTAALNTDVQTFFRKWLVDLTDDQLADGDFPKVAPTVLATGSGGPAWADAAIICPWAIYEVYGDKVILEKHYDAMAKFVDFRANSAPDYLAPKKFHCYGDWLNIDAKTPNEVIYAAYTAGNAHIMANIAAILGKAEDFAKYNKLYKDIKHAFNKGYVNEDGTIKGNTQTVYVLALWFDLVDGAMKEKAAQLLLEQIKQRNWHLSTGFVGTRDLMHVLTKIGRTDVAYRLLFTDTYPSWLFPVKNGATSIWERWNSWTPEKGFGDVGMNSFSHYTYGAVGQWMFENIGGIKAAKPGYKEIVIRPVITDILTWAKTSYDCIHGQIVVNWKRDGDKVIVNVTVPANVKATVYVPGKTEPVEAGSGSYEFQSDED